ncbi:unnamed protein product [Nesidiocoris tenuis]|uniref:Uncharacterized protein n=1 Tax=Nesidiocoris tenuis TaxID=355587 RepID=A0A6H5G7X7_9HEMI|nr:unnamed protein product [Nesidiocoris tenuis]
MSHRANQFRGREADEGGPFGIAVALDAYRNKRSPIEIREKNDEKKKKGEGAIRSDSKSASSGSIQDQEMLFGDGSPTTRSLLSPFRKRRTCGL